MRILMTVDEAKALVKSRLSEKRYKHTINVKKKWQSSWQNAMARMRKRPH